MSDAAVTARDSLTSDQNLDNMIQQWREAVAWYSEHDGQKFLWLFNLAQSLYDCVEAIRRDRAEISRLRAELEIAREAYTNIGSERDMIQAELDRVRELITRDEITRIREEIKDATDSKQCSKRDGFIIFGYRCDFWKRAALEVK